MTRALTLCSLFLLPLSACDDAAFDLAESAARPSAIPDPPEPPLPELCELYCSEHHDACGSVDFGVTCDRYCDNFRTVCSEEGSFETSFESPEKCRAWCDGERLLGDEDTIECRLDALEPSLASGPNCLAASPEATCD